jgi:type I restriction enzyme S subunit
MIFNASKFNSHWENKKLSELGSFNRGKSKHRPRNDKRLFENGTHPLVQTGEVREANLYIEHHSSAYNDFGLLQSKLWPSNTLCITIAANIAETALLSYPMCFPDSVVGFIAEQESTSELFMHYVFTYIRKAIQNSVQGSIQDNINIDYLTNLKFKIPPKPYQDKI